MEVVANNWNFLKIRDTVSIYFRKPIRFFPSISVSASIVIAELYASRVMDIQTSLSNVVTSSESCQYVEAIQTGHLLEEAYVPPLCPS